MILGTCSISSFCGLPIFTNLKTFSEKTSFKGFYKKKCKRVNWEIWKTTIACFLLKMLFK